MPFRKIYFVTGRKEKYEEMKEMFDVSGYQLEWYQSDIPELQTEDVEKLLRRKALDAFEKIRRPVLVEHTALKIEAFHELPGMQTSLFYSRIGCQNIIDFCKMKNQYGAEAESIIGFCDGKNIKILAASEIGTICKTNRFVANAFDWDSIFIPSENNPDNKTYAEMGAEKHQRSMRKKAWEQIKPLIQNASPLLFSGDDDRQLDELANLIREKKVLLFVGAGISASVSLPSWKELIEALGVEKGIDKDLFRSYGDYMLLAEYADDNGDSVYKQIKEKFDITDNDTIKKQLRESDIYRILYELDFPVIYTTNYDHLIEDYYNMQKKDGCTVVASISDMEKVESGKTRIMKFHGDVEQESSIVLSESQYFERMDYQSFMDIQLQADMLRYSVLFLGYSLSDINVKLMLYLAQKRWKATGSGKEKNAYIFTATPNYVQKEVFKKNGIISLSGDSADKGEGTLKFLQQLHEKVKNI